jgi:hypothetical protein
MREIFYIVLTIITLGLTSCVNEQFYTAYENRLDSLNASLEASASSFEQIDTVVVFNQNRTIMTSLDSIRRMQVDIVDGTINDYNNIGRAYKTFFRMYPLVMSELQYSRQQLADLKHDVENRHLDEELTTNYYDQEMDAVALLKRKMDKLSEIAEKQGKQFERLNPKVERIIDSLTKLK